MQAEFNQKAEKIVNTDEFQKIRDDLEWKQLNWKEKLFQAFVEQPYRAVLWVRRGFSEAYAQLTGKEKEPGNYYLDKLEKSSPRAATYMDRAMFEGDVAYFLKNGLSRTFQEKSANIAHEAFDKARDFSMLKRTGQLQALETVG